MTAADVEVQKIVDCGTVEVVEMPYSKKVVPMMWVFTYKLDDDGYLLKFKACLVV